MSRRRRLVDFGCGNGGSLRGYEQAGFEVVGVDILPQPNLAHEFVQMDAVEFMDRYGADFDVWTGSPPCQRWSRMSKSRPGLVSTYPDLITPWRNRMRASGKLWVLENVVGSPLEDPMTLCGLSFGKEMYRHRWFQSNAPLLPPYHPPHVVPASKAGHWVPGTFFSVAGHCAPMWKAREVMDIDWMCREDLVEAIPPYFAKHVGDQLMWSLEGAWPSTPSTTVR